jgi:hypothetical protein
METGVTKRLEEFLRKKKADYATLGSLPSSLKRRLTGNSAPSSSEVKKGIAPHLGENLTLRQGGRYTYLVRRQSEESLLFRIVQKRAGKTPSANNTPFMKDEYLAVLNHLIERGQILVKLNKSYKPVLFPAGNVLELETEKEKKKPEQESKKESFKLDVSEERFESAYREIEGGKFFVRVCDLRRRLGWTRREFDAIAAALRDAGKIQLQAGDTAYFDERDIADSFVDENGFRMLTLMWRA